MTTVKLAGFRELDKALSQLPKATGKAVLRKIAKGALQPMADDARARAPEDKGELKASISVSEKRTKAARVFKISPSSGITMAMGPAKTGRVFAYASYDEFGTVDTPAFAYMRGAYDAGVEPALDYIKVNLGAEIDRAAKRLSKRRG